MPRNRCVRRSRTVTKALWGDGPTLSIVKGKSQLDEVHDMPRWLQLQGRWAGRADDVSASPRKAPGDRVPPPCDLLGGC